MILEVMQWSSEHCFVMFDFVYIAELFMRLLAVYASLCRYYFAQAVVRTDVGQS